MDLLVVEDDPIMGKSLAKGFTEAGHVCTLVGDGDQGLAVALNRRFNAIILDLLLPGLPGLEVLRRLRAAGVRAPVILLTALGAVQERVTGLNAGADDYLVKPFVFAELLARLDAVCRRVQDPPTMMRAGELELDLTTRVVLCRNKKVNVTKTEFGILELLMRHAGKVVTRRMLCEHLWEVDWEGTTNVIEVHINRLRKKLDHEQTIQTVRGQGYALRTT